MDAVPEYNDGPGMLRLEQICCQTEEMDKVTKRLHWGHFKKIIMKQKYDEMVMQGFLQDFV